MNSYSLVLVSVLETKNMALFSMLEEAPIEARETVLESAFRKASIQREDESALQIFGWLMHAMSDREFFPVLKPGRFNYEFDMPNGGSFNPAVEKIIQDAAMLRAAKACGLYESLPKFENGLIRRLMTEEEYQKGDGVRRPTLMKTRESILTEIASQCFRTKNEEEAKTLLYFLLDSPTKFKEERELIRKVIQSTDNTADANRLERCFEWAMDKPRDLKMGRLFVNRDEVEEIAFVLAKGWTKNVRYTGRNCNGLQELLCRMKIFRPLIHSSDAAKEFVERISGEIAGVDRKVQCLVNRLSQPLPGKFFSEIPGEIKVAYDEEGLRIKNVTMTIIPPNAYSHLKKAEIFGLAADRVREWKNEEENATLRIRLMGKEDEFISEIGTY